MIDPVQDTTYRAHDEIEIRVRDLSRVGAVLDTVMRRGITEISDVQFAATDVAASQDSALREATVRARRQAETIAAASGLHLGVALSLSTQADYVERYRYPDFGFRGATSASEGSPAVVVQPSVPVSVTVYGRWELLTTHQ